MRNHRNFHDLKPHQTARSSRPRDDSTDVETARIVSIGIVLISADGRVGTAEEVLVNPGMPIPAETTAVHGITDDMVRDCPTFKGRSDWILEKLRGCDLSGFNVEKYDLPILKREFAKIGMNDVLADAKIIDVMVIYHRNVRRDHSAAVKYYLNRKGDVPIVVEIREAAS